MKAPFATALAAALLLAKAASADPFPARDTAHVMPTGKWRAGFVAPLEVGIGHGMELSTSLAPWFLLSPNGALRLELGHLGPVTVTGEYGLSFPTGAMYLLKGYVFPSFTHGGGEIGWSLVPALGLRASAGEHNVLTGSLETAFGIPLGPTDAKALDSYAPLELLFAPTLTGYRVRLGGLYDHEFLGWLRGRVGVAGYMVGKSPYPSTSPFYFSAEAGVEVRLGRQVRLCLGGAYFNYDQHQTAVEKGSDGRLHRVPVRSNDIYPTLDLIIGSK